MKVFAAGGVLVGMVLLLMSGKRDSDSSEWFLSHPRDLLTAIEDCTPVHGMRTAEDLRSPTKCTNADTALRIARTMSWLSSRPEEAKEFAKHCKSTGGTVRDNLDYAELCKNVAQLAESSTKQR